MRGTCRILLIASHPVQYAAPIYREMARHPGLEILVAYSSLEGAEGGVDREFGREVKWDLPLLDGYPWVQIPDRGARPGMRSLFQPGLWKLVRQGRFDAVVSYTGYRRASFWIAWLAARRSGTPFLFGTDAHEIRPRDARGWKIPLKRWAWPRLFGLADVVLAPSSGTVELLRSLRIPAERIALTPYVVDNAWWLEQASRVDRAASRDRWRVPGDAIVVLFCGKLQPWKRPLDLVRAFAQADVPLAHLVIAGEGPLRGAAEEEARRLGIADRVRFVGFVNQSELPGLYTASDLMVLPSDYDAFGVVVNEAMLCGCPVAASDRVGARFDLIQPGKTGVVFRCGDVDALAELLRSLGADPGRLRSMSVAARHRMETWSPRENVAGLVHAIQAACAAREGVSRGSR